MSKLTKIIGIFSFVLLSFVGCKGEVVMDLSPQEVVLQWMETTQEGDYSEYKEYFSSKVMDQGVYTSQEAMMFWGTQIAEIYEEGFDQEFTNEPYDSPEDENEYQLIFPIVENGPMGEAVVLIKEDGAWKIISLF